MRVVRWLQPFALVVAVPPGVASAVPLTLAFSGHVIAEVPGALYPVDTPFEGAVTYDSDVAPAFVEGSTRAGYLFPGGLGAASFAIGATRFESVTSDDPDVALLQLFVENDYAAPATPISPPSRPRDRYYYIYDQNHEAVLEFEFRTPLNLFRPIGAPPDPDVIQSLEIPMAASQFAGLTITTVRYRDPIGDWIVIGAVDSMTVVPEPSTFELVALGVSVLASARRFTWSPIRESAVLMDS